jgi:putative ABC transport system permease protein
MYLVVRAAGDAASLAAPLRALVRRLDPDLAITDAGLLEDRIHASIATPRFRTLLVATFAVLALLLSLIGTYGVMALLVAERQHEIGVRMALGARRGRVLRGVLADGARLILAGLVVGMPAALLASRALVTLLFGVEPRDPVTHAVAAAVLIIAALLACLVPALRASRLDPLLALRD